MPPATANPTTPPAPSEAVALADRLRPVLLHLSRHLRREVPGTGLTAGQLEILALVAHRPGVGVNELAGQVGITAASMSNAIDKLEAAGLAVRTREAAGDRRRVGVAVTPEGETAVREARGSRTAWLASRIRALHPADRESLTAAIPALEEIVEARRLR